MGSVGTSLVVRITDDQGEQSAPKFENVDTVFLEKTSVDGATAITLRKPDNSWTKAIEVRFKKIGIEFDSKQTLSLRITNEQEEQPALKFENVDTVYLERISDDGATAITVRKADQSWIKAIDKAVKFKKIGVELEQAPIDIPQVGEEPPITVPSTWSSEKWNNGKERTIATDGSDPLDPQFAVRQLDEGGYCKILGNGTTEIKGKGRFYVFKKDAESALTKQTQYLWKPSVEVSFDINVDGILSSDKRFINLGGCTNHFADVSNNSNGRNYSVVGRYDGDGIGFKKETIHGAYDEYSMINKKLKTKTWYNIRYKQTPIDTDRKIKLEGWLDGNKIGEFIDDGNMTKDTSEIDPVVRGGDKSALYYPIKNGKMVWTAGGYSGLYIRLTGTIKTFIKNLSVKEV